jgi:peroxiredoxin Q/BCP
VKSGETGLAVGSVAPEFTLESHAGGQVSLADYRNTRDLVLFFPASFT